MFIFIYDITSSKLCNRIIRQKQEQRDRVSKHRYLLNHRVCSNPIIINFEIVRTYACMEKSSSPILVDDALKENFKLYYIIK